MMNKLNEIQDVNLMEDNIDLHPSISYDVKNSEKSFQKILGVWVLIIAEASKFSS